MEKIFFWGEGGGSKTTQMGEGCLTNMHTYMHTNTDELTLL